MGVKKLEIKLTNSIFRSYLPGQVIKGTVTVSVDSPCKSKGLCLWFYGAANANWVEVRGNTRYIYKIREPYFDGKVYLFGSASGPDIDLSVGTKTYPFVFKLPEALPTTFKSGAGKVEYFIECRLHRVWVSDNGRRLTFSVRPVLDLRPISILLQFARRIEEEGTVCCCCCASGPVNLTLTQNKGGFVPGEQLAFTAKVENNSRAKMSVYLYLKQMIDIRARGGHHHQTKYIARNKLGSVLRGETGQWSQQLTVPDLPPTGLPNCVLIKVKYHLCLNARTFGGQLEAVSEIFIGTIPVENTFQQHMREQSRFSAQNRTHNAQGPPAYPVQTTYDPNEAQTRAPAGVIPLPYQPLHQTRTNNADAVEGGAREERGQSEDDVKCILDDAESTVAGTAVPLPYEPLHRPGTCHQAGNRVDTESHNTDDDVGCILDNGESCIDDHDTIQLLSVD